jgi:hypothetical protein
MKHIQRLRKMITLAYHMEWPEREYLTELELGSIEALSPSVERLEVVMKATPKSGVLENRKIE